MRPSVCSSSLGVIVARWPRPILPTPPRPRRPRGPSLPEGERTGRRLRLDDILKLMVAEGLVPAADAEKLRSSRTHRFEHPLEMIADQKWRAPEGTRPLMTLEWLVEWVPGKPGGP